MYRDISPYVFTHNNPVNRIDIDGKQDPSEEEKKKAEEARRRAEEARRILEMLNAKNNNQPAKNDATAVATKLSTQNVQSNSTQTNGTVNALKAAATVAVGANYARGVVDALRITLLSSSSLAKIADNVVKATKPLGRVAAVASVYLTYSAHENGEISSTRAAYDATATVISYTVGVMATPAAGLATGLTLQGAAYAGDKVVDYGLQVDRYANSEKFIQDMYNIENMGY
jgi:sRNA-binding protein